MRRSNSVQEKIDYTKWLYHFMGPFILDLVLGFFFGISILISVVGLLVFRYRRGIGPAFLMISGIVGIISSIIGLLSRSGLIDLPDMFLFIFIGISLVMILISVILWRPRK